MAAGKIFASRSVKQACKKIHQAKAIIKAALAKGGVWAVSCSGGKDSIALLDMCLKSGWKGPVLHFHYDETPDENTFLVKSFCQQNSLKLHMVKVLGAFDIYKQIGHFFVFPRTKEEKKAVAEMLKTYKQQVDGYAKNQNWQGQFLGLRKEESKPRTRTLNQKGYIYQTADRTTWTACPLANWKTEDVWAYILANNLPYLKRYDYANDPERERSEMTWLAAESLWRYGLAARLKRENPEEFKRLALLFPDIRRFV